MQNFFNREIVTFMSFVNTLGAKERLKQRNRNFYKMSFYWNFTIFCEPFAYETAK